MKRVLRGLLDKVPLPPAKTLDDASSVQTIDVANKTDDTTKVWKGYMEARLGYLKLPAIEQDVSPNRGK